MRKSRFSDEQIDNGRDWGDQWAELPRGYRVGRHQDERSTFNWTTYCSGGIGSA